MTDGDRLPHRAGPRPRRAMARLTAAVGWVARRWPSTQRPRRPAPAGRATSGAAGDYPGDATGPVRISYQPYDDDRPDPGEVVWAWVPFEEDHTRGKDRPVLVIGREDPWLLALQVTSQDHDRDAAAQARAGRYWVDIGTGGWDPRGRASEVRVNRVIRLAPHAVRRIGARLPRDRFDQVAAAVDRYR